MSAYKSCTSGKRFFHCPFFIKAKFYWVVPLLQGLSQETIGKMEWSVLIRKNSLLD